MPEKIKIKDESEDKKYFTIIPNYILNHSTLWDREVYIQMKRITGEDGTCWTSQKTLAKQCGISINRLKKSLKYLLECKWIKQIGVKKITTKGGEQEVNEYSVANLWKLNMGFYETKGVSREDIPITKGVSRDDQRGITAEAKGVSRDDDKEERREEERREEEQKSNATGVADNEIGDFINIFKENNPSYERLFGNKTERAASQRLLDKYKEKAFDTAKFAVSVSGKPFAPVITTPYQLEKKLGDLMAYYYKEKGRKHNLGVIKT